MGIKTKGQAVCLAGRIRFATAGVVMDANVLVMGIALTSMLDGPGNLVLCDPVSCRDGSTGARPVAVRAAIVGAVERIEYETTSIWIALVRDPVFKSGGKAAPAG